MIDDAEKLIAALEAAESGNRALDAEIALLIGAPQAYFNGLGSDVDGYPFGGFGDVDGPDCFDGDAIWAGGGRSWCSPAYTESVDDALALVPEGWGWIVSRFLELRIGLQGFTCVLERPTGDGDREPIGFMTMPAVVAATPALALCAAILRANGESND